MAAFNLAAALASTDEGERCSDDQFLTTVELVEAIKAMPRAACFMANVRCDARIVDEHGALTDRMFAGCIGYAVQVTRKDALWNADRMLPAGLESRGGRIRVYLSLRIKTRWTHGTRKDTKQVTLWIG